MSSKGVTLNTTDAVNDEPDLKEFTRRPWARHLTIGRLTGGAAIGDTKADVYVEDTRVASLESTRTGLMGNKDDDQPIQAPVPPNAQIRLVITDVPNTNAARCVLYAIP